MAIGTALAIGLGLAGASAGAQIYGAKKAAGTAREAGQIQSEAANRAAELQFQGSQDALNYLREEAAFHRQAQAPYRAIGTGAIRTLSNLTGVPMVADAALAGPSGQTLATLGAPTSGPNLPARPVGFGQTAAAEQQTGGLVLLRAPNGTQKRVPANQVPHYLARGAQVIN